MNLSEGANKKKGGKTWNIEVIFNIKKLFAKLLHIQTNIQMN